MQVGWRHLRWRKLVLAGRSSDVETSCRWLFLLVPLVSCPRVTIGWAPVYVHCKRCSLTDSANGAFGAGDTLRVVVRSQPQTNDYGVQWSTGRHALVRGRATRSHWSGSVVDEGAASGYRPEPSPTLWVGSRDASEADG